MKTRFLKALGYIIGVALYGAVLAAGAYAAVGITTWLAYATETTFLDVAAVLAVALYGMHTADRMLSAMLRVVLKAMLVRVVAKLRRVLGRTEEQTDDEAVERVPVWLERPPCEGTYLVQHPDGEIEHGVQVKRYLPRKGLWAILLQGLTDVEDLVGRGYRFDGPLSRESRG